MGRHNAVLGTLTIPSGQTVNNIILGNLGMGYASDMSIETPAALTGTAVLQASLKSGATASDMKNVNIGGSDLTLAANKVVPVPPTAFKAIRALSDSSEAPDTLFQVIIQTAMGT